MSTPPDKLSLLGPFVGNITADSGRIWLHIDLPRNARGDLHDETAIQVFVTLHRSTNQPPLFTARMELGKENHGNGIVQFDQLEPNSVYFYGLWLDEACSQPLDLDGLTPKDLFFWTLPEKGYDKQLDFLLMSCHNPEEAKGDGYDGCAVWRQIPEILGENKNVRFALMVGDQVYADDIEQQVLSEKDDEKRHELYLSMYRKYWSNIHYRRVLCSLPAIMMWDDHDITDGWGSREDSFVDDSAEFKPEWQRLFKTAKHAFAEMQASRNPPPLSQNYEAGFDTCFKIGGAGFAVADLRSNRNVRQGRICLAQQLDSIAKWVEQNRKDLHTFFFVSSVVFSHGAPQVDSFILKSWLLVLTFFRWLEKFPVIKRPAAWFNRKLGDLRDDINDSWGSERNRAEAQRVLDFLFRLQNPIDDERAVNVVILTGDIHTPGYSTIYSADPKHKKAVIPHIVGTPVAYEPFSWVGEAVFRHLTRVVSLGEKGSDGKHIYTAQVSHHFCYRNVVVVSLRNYESDESHLKAKYYLEGFPEPQVLLFDLNHGSHREAIDWPEPEAKQPLP